MKVYKTACRDQVSAFLTKMYDQQFPGQETPWSQDSVQVEIPPRPELGDMAVPLFPFARYFRKAPPVLAAELAHLYNESQEALSSRAVAEGPYLNVFLVRQPVSETVLERILLQADNYGSNDSLAGRRVMIEFSCPNTNKPLHLGHLRNNALGESVSRLLRACGAQVHKVNLINDRGVHICKSMLAYQHLSGGETPETSGRKSDHFVGDYYVKYNQWAKTDPTAEQQAQEMLRAWEAGDQKVRDLWETMNQWAIQGIQKTYERTGVSFDQIYFEHETYLLGKSEILKGLESGAFYKREDGAIVVDLPWRKDEEERPSAKVLLRSDGTSIYLTQDIGTAISRSKDWAFDELIYVVASEQDYHFQVLFYVLGLLGYKWASNLYHLSYGMVNLPEGKMKSREGTVVDADNLLDELEALALEEIRSKGRETGLENLEQVTAGVALGALHYFLLQAVPSKDMIFNSQESLSFNGNTGPYLQYMGARISTMLEKAPAALVELLSGGGWKGSLELLDLQEEWEIVKALLRFPDLVEDAAQERNPQILTVFLYELAKTYSRYYHDHPILRNEDETLSALRLLLSRAVLQVLKNGFALLNIPFLRSM